MVLGESAGLSMAEGRLMVAPDALPTIDPARLLAAISQAVFVLDTRWTIISWNPAAERLYGWSAAEAIGRDSLTLLLPAGRDQRVEQVMIDLLDGGSFTGVFSLQHKDGSLLRVTVTDTPVLDAEGAVHAIVVVSDGMQPAVVPLLANCREAVLVVGGDGLIHFASASVTQLFGWVADDIVATPVLPLVHPEDHARAAAMAAHCLIKNAPHQEELRVRGPLAEWRWANVSVTNLISDPSVRALVVHLHDITDRRAALAEIEHLRGHDPLTGLPHREQMLERLRQANPDRGTAGALLVVQLDHDAGAAQELGHAGQDVVLRAVARRLSATLLSSDSCGSLGGGGFVVLAESVTSPASVAALAEQIQLALGRVITMSGTTVRPLVSIGSTLLAGRRRSHELLDEATAAMQVARSAGPGNSVLFDDRSQLLPSGDGRKHRLARALDDGELTVHYQPVIDLVSRQVVGVEALLRWEHPDQGLLSAGAFLEAAEQTDLINDIGAFVLHRACRQVASWPGEPLALAVNVSGRQLADSALAAVIDSALAVSGLPPSRLILEITETALLHDLSTARRTLVHCRAQGIRVSIDDFGTGFAGYHYLRDLPVDEIKIDQSFTAGLTEDGFAAAIVSGITHMAHKLALKVTAEGIESEQQAVILTSLGCDRGQGFLWSAAQPGHAAPLIPAPLIPVQRSPLG